MGVTGAGKSTFVRHCTKDLECILGHDLFSYTSKVSIHTTRILDRTVHLIDTPGFNDSRNSDEETLQELAYWLAAAYERDIQLSGIIYLHRITDTRLQGSSLRALNAFQAMCGENAFCGVVVATTMWDTVPTNELAKAANRHEELRGKIRQGIIQQGGKLIALSAANIDAVNIVEHIVRKNERLTLAFQQQLMDDKRLIYETDAGKVIIGASSHCFQSVQSATNQSYKRMVGMVEAGQVQDSQEFQDSITNMKEAMASAEDEIEHMKVTLSDIRKSWDEILDRDNKVLQDAVRQNDEHMRARAEEHQSTRRNHFNGVSCDLSCPTRMSTPSSANSSAIAGLSMLPACQTSEAAISSSEINNLARSQQVLKVGMAQRLSMRYTTHGVGSTRIGIIGTSVAVGQLIATLACTVM
ncbi:hypothetical protein BKA66DRAFT_427492 [Pyrenochaeta sp. MPI-SDFR-AT-0127]|nr:hypothetical protein BKA66DRAFT_427492 [Pyrenochaeta sp. MPI-SDFR-AT-0127]